MNKYSLGMIPIFIFLVPNVYAGGPRLDYDQAYEDVPGAPQCWIDGYDAGFAGKYDKKRADECNAIPGDQYNASWKYACRDAGYIPDECKSFKNNPVDIEDHQTLYQENADNCYRNGIEDGKAHNPINETRDKGCGEYNPNYEEGYKFGCETDNTDNECELAIRGEDDYCPWHPDIAGCVEFLHNATNKMPASPYGACAGMGDPRPNIICPQESNPEGYCLMTDDSVFCKTIGDICDVDGFVKPEYPYCIN